MWEARKTTSVPRCACPSLCKYTLYLHSSAIALMQRMSQRLHLSLSNLVRANCIPDDRVSQDESLEYCSGQQ